MPLSAFDIKVKTDRMLSKAELPSLGELDLKVQKAIRQKLYHQLVGTLYPGILADEIAFIEDLIRAINE